MFGQMKCIVAAAVLLCIVADDKQAHGHNVNHVIVDSPVPSHNQHISRTAKHNTKQVVAHNISIVGDDFMVDGQPLHIISGSLHYFRLPAAYWRDRLRKLKAAGLNSVSTYVEWSYHEPEEGEYSFTGDRDVAQFVRLAAEEGLHVLLRPGPYICAERDLGGFPYWLLGKYNRIVLRSTDKDYIRETTKWFNKLFEQLSPLLFGNGGPIILVQVENEYGSYGSDMPYKEQLRDIIRAHVGTNALLYTTDGTSSSMIQGGMIPGTLTTIDFGVGSDISAFKTLRRFMPEGPLMNSEFYPGWLTHWGETLQLVDTQRVVDSLEAMVTNKINVNIYVFFGGTNFEFTAGANKFSMYQPDITSYDYDAPLNEAGDPTPKYYAIRQALLKRNPSLEDIPVPTPSPKGAYGPVTLRPKLGLLSAEGRSTMGKNYNDFPGNKLPTFEYLRQRAGLMLYETKLKQGGAAVLQVKHPRDWIYAYVDGELVGTMSRMLGTNTLPITANVDSTLSLLVETQGRINYGSYIHDYKGILGLVTFNDTALDGRWNVTGYPLQEVKSMESTPVVPSINRGPVVYDGHFTINNGEPLYDTFIDPTGWGRGYIWINGYNLGRYWPGLGPQVTLYVPGVWLKPPPEQNHLRVLELEKIPEDLTMTFIDYPILNRTSYIYPKY